MNVPITYCVAQANQAKHPLAFHHDQSAQGKGRNLNHGLPNGLQRASIHPYGKDLDHDLPNQL